MRKKITVILLIGFALQSYSQNCIPDTSITSPGIYPEQLDTATANESYSFTIQVLALKDTMVNFMGNIITAQVDSVSLDSIHGLPSGFTFNCEPVNCVFDYTTVGCINLAGNPTNSDSGAHPLTIFTTAYARLGIAKLPVPDTISDYTLVVLASANASISQVASNGIQIFPNPTNGQPLNISSKNLLQHVDLVDINGRILISNQDINAYKIQLETSSIIQGTYFLRVYTSNGTTRHMIVL